MATCPKFHVSVGLVENISPCLRNVAGLKEFYRLILQKLLPLDWAIIGIYEVISREGYWMISSVETIWF